MSGSRRMALETDRIRRYLLGDASTAEHENIAMRISEEEFERDIAIAENELIEEYLEGTLPQEERELFESHYLSSDKHRDLVSELALLKRYSSGPAEAYLTGEMRAVQALPSRYRHLTVATAIVLVGILGSLSWWMFQTEQRPAIEQEYIRLNAGDLGDLSRYPSMVLAPVGQIRQAQEPRFKTDGPGTGFLFRMPVNGDGTYNATLSVNGREAFAVTGSKVYSADGSGEVRLLVPRGAITKGQAEIVLTGGGGALVYPFMAE